MQLVEQHIIKKNHRLFKEIDRLSFLSKNLYNKANYIIRQQYIKTSQDGRFGEYIGCFKLQKELQNQKDPDYYALPTKVSVQIVRVLDKNWKSFIRAYFDWMKHPNKYKGEPKMPKYKDKKLGRNLLIYTNEAVSVPKLRNGIILLSGSKISFPTKQKDICQARIIPRAAHYVIEVVYEKEVQDLGLNKRNIAGIDLGINNLATVTSNQNSVRPILINGRALKSLNQYYNKKRARYMSYVGSRGISNKLIQLTNKRNRKVKDFMHKASKMVVDHLIKNDIGTLVIGYTKHWKTGVNLGHVQNQEFVCIPHLTFVNMVKYKCELVGIDVIEQEENHTSVCSFIDLEEIGEKEKYVGRRVKRGLFISKEGIKINADSNGSGNIIRKAIPNAFADGIEGVVVRPIRVNPYKQVA